MYIINTSIHYNNNFYHILPQDMLNFAYVINSKWGVIMCAILHGGGGGCNMDFSKWWPNILHEIEYLVFHNYFVFLGKNKFFFQNSRFPVRSVFVITSLFTFVVCYYQNGLRRKHGKCSLYNK